MNNNKGNSGFNFIDMDVTKENSCGGGCSCNPFDDCCDDIIRLLRRILWNIKDFEGCNCDEILRLLRIIIRLLRKKEDNECCICDSDNNFNSEIVNGSKDDFITLDAGDRRITAITAVYDSFEASRKPATGMTLTITGGSGSVYSQYIAGSIPSRKIGSLTIAFTHPIFVPGQAAVNIELAESGMGADGNALVSVNIASCPVEEEIE